ncbi:MAG: hypothetical protein AAGJ46_19815, partial [Planctomycetota bacterium]
LVQDAGTFWCVDAGIDVGTSGAGTLDISGGAAVTASSVRLASSRDGYGRVRVSGSGSVLVATNQFDVSSAGSAGNGELQVTDGGLVNASDVTTSVIGSLGRLSLDGGVFRVNSLTNHGVVAGGGTIEGRGDFTNERLLLVGPGEELDLAIDFANDDQLLVDGGTLFSEEPIENQGSGLITLDGGILIGATPSAASTGLDNDGTLASVGAESSVFGEVASSGVITAADNSSLRFHDDVDSTSGSTIEVFAGSRIVALKDLTVRSGAELRAQISGSDVGSGLGVLEVVGDLAISGVLQVSAVDLSSPAVGDTYSIATAAGAIDSSLTLTSSPVLPTGLEWRLRETARAIDLVIVSALPGDYNADGVVDTADYTVWRDALDTPGLLAAADGDTDGDIDVDDYVIWRNNFGATLAGAAVTPEPVSLWLVAIGVPMVKTRAR